ncbi:MULTISPECIES: hypothetical protein [unclassified Microcoleus]|uniref:hypothetical protein n=1 Tax=unclassified Microcoleus TaxID=2642155 RepID=UPI002FD65187
MTYNITPNTKAQPQSSDMSPMELALLGGDLSKLSEKDRAAYYSKVCESVGLNPLTWPFEYIKLDGKLKLYAKKDCADQLRNLRGVSISKAETRIENGIAIVEVTATTKDGRSDCDMGCVPIAGLSGNALGNALMKAVTKAKRRVTLSICGLGWLDETEVEAIEPVRPQEKVLPSAPIAPKQLKSVAPVSKLLPTTNPAASSAVADTLHRLKWTDFQIQNCLTANFGKVHPTELTNEELLDFLDYLAVFEQTSAEVRRLHWTPEQGKEVLKFQFGLETRNSLTFEQLKKFLELLKRQPANPA